MFQPSQRIIDFIKQQEGCILHAYQDQASVWTIAFGCICYPNGINVKKGDQITQAQADYYLMVEVNRKSLAVNNLIQGVTLNQNQYDALVDFSYNLGSEALHQSHLLIKIKANPHDPSIRDEFMKWDKVHRNGQVVELDNLKHRRKLEADIYFS